MLPPGAVITAPYPLFVKDLKKFYRKKSWLHQFTQESSQGKEGDFQGTKSNKTICDEKRTSKATKMLAIVLYSYFIFRHTNTNTNTNNLFPPFHCGT
jgi:hypothetical protein